MNIKAFKPKIYLMSLSFDLGPLKMNINALDKSQFWTIKRIHIMKHI